MRGLAGGVRHLLIPPPRLADDESQIIRHFVEDLYKYEFLSLAKMV
jgi:hypothetical protein